MPEIAGESSGDFPTRTPTGDSIEENFPWAEYALQQAQIAQKTIETNLENAIEVTRSRVDRIRTTSSAHFNQTIVIFPISQLFPFSLFVMISLSFFFFKEVLWSLLALEENIAKNFLWLFAVLEKSNKRMCVLLLVNFRNMGEKDGLGLMLGEISSMRESHLHLMLFVRMLTF